MSSLTLPFDSSLRRNVDGFAQIETADLLHSLAIHKKQHYAHNSRMVGNHKCSANAGTLNREKQANAALKHPTALSFATYRQCLSLIIDTAGSRSYSLSVATVFG